MEESLYELLNGLTVDQFSEATFKYPELKRLGGDDDLWEGIYLRSLSEIQAVRDGDVTTEEIYEATLSVLADKGLQDETCPSSPRTRARRSKTMNVSARELAERHITGTLYPPAIYVKEKNGCPVMFSAHSSEGDLKFIDMPHIISAADLENNSEARTLIDRAATYPFINVYRGSRDDSWEASMRLYDIHPNSLKCVARNTSERFIYYSEGKVLPTAMSGVEDDDVVDLYKAELEKPARINHYREGSLVFDKQNEHVVMISIGKHPLMLVSGCYEGIDVFTKANLMAEMMVYMLRDLRGRANGVEWLEHLVSHLCTIRGKCVSPSSCTGSTDGQSLFPLINAHNEENMREKFGHTYDLSTCSKLSLYWGLTLMGHSVLDSNSEGYMGDTMMYSSDTLITRDGALQALLHTLYLLSVSDERVNVLLVPYRNNIAIVHPYIISSYKYDNLGTDAAVTNYALPYCKLNMGGREDPKFANLDEVNIVERKDGVKMLMPYPGVNSNYTTIFSS